MNSWSFIPSLLERRNDPELLDLRLDAYTVQELQGTLGDIEVINAYLGDYRAVLKHLSRMVAAAGESRFTALDIGSGSGDIPLAIARWAGRAGVQSQITALDNNRETIAIATSRIGAVSGIRMVAGDALDLPFSARSFDFVLCCKTLHHFSNDQAVRLIREAARVARRGFLILDLRRSRTAYLLISLLTRLFTRNRLTRNDGPLSVLRSFTPVELSSVAHAAGVRDFTVTTEPFWLMVLSGCAA